MKECLILMWDPKRSWKPEEYQDFVDHRNKYFMDDEEDVNMEDEEDGGKVYEHYDTLSWSVNEYKKLRGNTGVRCYLMKVGDDHPGLMVNGFTLFNPYKDEDWSGQGRETYYVHFHIRYMSDYDTPMIPLEVLEREIPDFNWRGGHSGRFLTEEQSESLYLLWLEMLYKNNPEKLFNDIDELNESTVKLTLRNPSLTRCSCCGYDYQKLNPHMKLHHSLYLFWPSKSVREQEGDTVYKHIHAICRNCWELNMGYLRKMAGESYAPEENDNECSYYYSEKLHLYLRVDSNKNFFTKSVGCEEDGPIAVEYKLNYSMDAYIKDNGFKKISKKKYLAGK